MTKELLQEAITLLEKSRDRLILKEEHRLKAGEITAFIKKVRGE
jgi:hypothetical protein